MTTYTFSPDVLALNPGLCDATKPTAKHAKYGNVRTEVDGIKFDSIKEARDYGALKLLEQAGQIRNLVLQPRFTLQAANEGIRAIEYVADFMWLDTHTGKTHVKDSKGFRTKEFRIKEKMFRKLYPQYVYEVG